MVRFSMLEVVGLRARQLVSSGFAAGLLASALLLGCGATEADQAQQAASTGAGPDAPGDCGASGPAGPGGCFACEDLLAQPCLCKQGGQVVPCSGAALAACKADLEEQYQACELQQACDREVLQPKLAQCPAKNTPDFKACYTRAYEAYSACLGGSGGGGGGNPGGGTGG